MNEESRPEAALEEQAVAAGSESHSPTAEARFAGAYAVLVSGKTVRRHLYLNLPAAERQVKRARARGDQADMTLVMLVPVDFRHLDQPASQMRDGKGVHLKCDPSADDLSSADVTKRRTTVYRTGPAPRVIRRPAGTDEALRRLDQ